LNTGDTCGATGNNQGACNIIDGRMTFYADGESDYSSIEGLICDALGSSGTPGSAFAHPAIKSLKCSITTTGGAPDGDNSVNNGQPQFDTAYQRYTTPVAVMSTCAAVMVVFGVYAYRRKQKVDEGLPRHHNHLDDSDVNNSNSISFEDMPMAWSAQSCFNGPAFDMQSIIPKGSSPVRILKDADSIHSLPILLFADVSVLLLNRRQLRNVPRKKMCLRKYHWISLI